VSKASVAHAYSDLLLHDIDTGDGVSQGAARGNEFRTAPLWGLRFAPTFMHDGRASSIEEAISAHGGQAAASRDEFFRLSASEQHELIEELKRL
jgi:CxxC motif-containing protein (DUF1111 family)